LIGVERISEVSHVVGGRPGVPDGDLLGKIVVLKQKNEAGRRVEQGGFYTKSKFDLFL